MVAQLAKRDRNVCVSMVTKFQLHEIALIEEKINFEGFT